MRVISKSEAPLEETEFKVMLELMGNESDNKRPGLDLVTILDLSRSMKGERLDKGNWSSRNLARSIVCQLSHSLGTQEGCAHYAR